MECNCSPCRGYGVLWAYCNAEEVRFGAASTPTDSYAWNGRNVDFDRCATCGYGTRWLPRDVTTKRRRWVNARLLPPLVLYAAHRRRLDEANTKRYLD